MACSPARTCWIAWLPVSAPSACTYGWPLSRTQSRCAPRVASVCSMVTDPRRRCTSAAEYGRTMPCQRADVAHWCSSAPNAASRALAAPLPLPLWWPLPLPSPLPLPLCETMARLPGEVDRLTSEQVVRERREELGARVGADHPDEQLARLFETTSREPLVAQRRAELVHLFGHHPLDEFDGDHA